MSATVPGVVDVGVVVDDVGLFKPGAEFLSAVEVLPLGDGSPPPPPQADKIREPVSATAANENSRRFVISSVLV